MQDDFNLEPLGPDWVATEFPGQLVDTVFQSCTTGPSVAGASAVMAVSYLTKTSTARVSDSISTSPSASSPATRLAQTASTQGSLQPATRPDVLQSPNPTSTEPPATIRPVIKSSATVPSPLLAKIPTSDREPAAKAAPSPPSPPEPVTVVPSGSNEISSTSAVGLLPTTKEAPSTPPSPEPATSVPSRSNEVSPTSAIRLVPVAGSSPVYFASDQQSLSAIYRNTQTGNTESSPQPSSATVATTTFGAKTYAAGPEFTSGYVFGTQTLLPGGPVVTVSGISVSLPTETALEASDIPVAIMTSEGTTYTVGPEFTSGYVFGSQTLVPGGSAIIVSGTQISLPSEAAPRTSGAPGAVIISDGEPYTAGKNSVSAYVIGTQTLLPGAPAITVSGTQISLAPDATEIVVGTGDQARTQTTDVGGYITSGLGGSAPAASSGVNSDDGAAQISTRSTATRTRNTASMSGGVDTSASDGTTTLSSNTPAFTDAASYTRQLGANAAMLWAALWCIWGFLRCVSGG
jgi:hypothetical protein